MAAQLNAVNENPEVFREVGSISITLNEGKARCEAYISGPINDFGLVRVRAIANSTQAVTDAHITVIVKGQHTTAQLVLRRQVALSGNTIQQFDFPFEWRYTQPEVEVALDAQLRPVKPEAGFGWWGRGRGYDESSERRSIVVLTEEAGSALNYKALQVMDTSLGNLSSLPRNPLFLASNFVIAWAGSAAPEPAIRALLKRFVELGGVLIVHPLDHDAYPGALVESVLGDALSAEQVARSMAAVHEFQLACAALALDDGTHASIDRAYSSTELPVFAGATSYATRRDYSRLIDGIKAGSQGSIAPAENAERSLLSSFELSAEALVAERAAKFAIFGRGLGALVVLDADLAELDNALNAAQRETGGNHLPRLIGTNTLMAWPTDNWSAIENLLNHTQSTISAADEIVPPKPMVVIFSLAFLLIPGVIVFALMRKRFPAGIFLICGGACAIILVLLYATTEVQRGISNSAVSLNLIMLNEEGEGCASYAMRSLVHEGKQDYTSLHADEVIGLYDSDEQNIEFQLSDGGNRLRFMGVQPWLAQNHFSSRALESGSVKTELSLRIESEERNRVVVTNTGSEDIPFGFILFDESYSGTAVFTDLKAGETRTLEVGLRITQPNGRLMEEYYSYVPKRLRPWVASIDRYYGVETEMYTFGTRRIRHALVIPDQDSLDLKLGVLDESNQEYVGYILPLRYASSDE